MKVDVLLGLQWGDEGKGKIVDVLTPEYDVIARFQGGPNAGHTLEFDGIKHVLHTIPSGVFRPDTLNVVGNGVVIDPIIFKKEIDALVALGVDVASSLAISRKAHLILPTHRLLDAASEAAKGKAKIGSTLKGIGPTYMDKTGRNGLRVGDIESSHFEERYQALRNKHEAMLAQFDGFDYTLDDAEWLNAIAFLRGLTLIDSEHDMNAALKSGKRILAEGAQGTMLDIDFGTYPFVTSSNPSLGGVCSGLGLAPNKFETVIGVAKAYTTRVGAGPYPTELFGELADDLREKGYEYGTTTGRPRRIGWLDVVALNYASAINGFTHLNLTKLDVLSGLPELKIATAYKLGDGTVTNAFPSSIEELEKVECVYETMPGWEEDISKMRDWDERPAKCKAYVEKIEELTGVECRYLGVGPGRDAIVVKP